MARSDDEDLTQKVMPHLLSLCPACRSLHHELHTLQQQVRHWDELIFLNEGVEAPLIWNRIASLSPADQLQAIEDDPTTHTWGFCRLLQRRSQEAIAENRLAQAGELAQLALRVGAHLLPESYDPDWIADLQVHGHVQLGTARRLSGDFAGAEAAFDSARQLLRCGTGDLAVEGHLLAEEALLLRDQHKLEATAMHLQRAIEILEAAAENPVEEFEQAELWRVIRVAREHLAETLEGLADER